MHAARARRPGEAIGLTGAALGVLVMLAGTFSPWLTSGTSQRNIYSAAGVIQRIAGLGTPVDFVLDALPFLGLYLVLAGVLFLLGRRRLAATAVGLAAIALGVLAGAATTHETAGPVHIASAGPVITLLGAGVTIVALIALAGTAYLRYLDGAPVDTLPAVVPSRSCASTRPPTDAQPNNPVAHLAPVTSSTMEFS